MYSTHPDEFLMIRKSVSGNSCWKIGALNKLLSIAYKERQQFDLCSIEITKIEFYFCLREDSSIKELLSVLRLS